MRWNDLPLEMGGGSGVSCWRRLRDWQQAGVWDRLHEVLLAKLRAADKIDFSRVIVVDILEGKGFSLMMKPFRSLNG